MVASLRDFFSPSLSHMFDESLDSCVKFYQVQIDATENQSYLNNRQQSHTIEVTQVDIASNISPS